MNRPSSHPGLDGEKIDEFPMNRIGGKNLKGDYVCQSKSE